MLSKKFIFVGVTWSSLVIENINIIIDCKKNLFLGDVKILRSDNKPKINNKMKQYIKKE